MVTRVTNCYMLSVHFVPSGGLHTLSPRCPVDGCGPHLIPRSPSASLFHLLDSRFVMWSSPFRVFFFFQGPASWLSGSHCSPMSFHLLLRASSLMFFNPSLSSTTSFPICSCHRMCKNNTSIHFIQWIRIWHKKSIIKTIYCCCTRFDLNSFEFTELFVAEQPELGLHKKRLPVQTTEITFYSFI